MDDLAPLVPDGVAEPMADAREGGTAGFPFAEFLERVGDRTGTTDADALRYARAVGATLVEAVGGEEIHDARSQLPNEYDRLFWATTPREFLDAVRREGGIDSDEEARAATTATLSALGERLTAGEAEDVAVFLPDEFAEAILAPGTAATDLPAEEFLERVAERAEVELGVARTYVQAVTAALAEAVPDYEYPALAEAVPDYEYRNVLDQLPDAYGPLLGAIVGRDAQEDR